jgi:alkylation response protein AidB-like acyl-CoA dehydrogenase
MRWAIKLIYWKLKVELMEKSGALGLLGAHIPEVYGGNPLDTNSNTLIGEELGKAGGSFDTTYAAHIGIGMLPILYFGTEEQKKKFLPGLCSGELKGILLPDRARIRIGCIGSKDKS